MLRRFLTFSLFFGIYSIGTTAVAQSSPDDVAAAGDVANKPHVDEFGIEHDTVWRTRRADKMVELKIQRGPANSNKIVANLKAYNSDGSGGYSETPDNQVINMVGRVKAGNEANRKIHRFILTKDLTWGKYLLVRGVFRTGKTEERDIDDMLLIKNVRTVDPLGSDPENQFAPVDPCEEYPDDDVMEEEYEEEEEPTP